MGRLGARVPRGHARLHLPQHVCRHGEDLRDDARGQRQAQLEAYDVGHLFNIAHLLERDLLDRPIHIQFVLGVLGANQARIDQTMHMLHTARSLFGEDFTWSAAGIGYPAEYQLAALGIMLGGQLRVGLEDNLRLSRERRADTNAELVAKAVQLAAIFDRPPATPDQARAFFGLKGLAAVAY